MAEGDVRRTQSSQKGRSTKTRQRLAPLALCLPSTLLEPRRFRQRVRFSRCFRICSLLCMGTPRSFGLVLHADCPLRPHHPHRMSLWDRKRPLFSWLKETLGERNQAEGDIRCARGFVRRGGLVPLRMCCRLLGFATAFRLRGDRRIRSLRLNPIRHGFAGRASPARSSRARLAAASRPARQLALPPWYHAESGNPRCGRVQSTRLRAAQSTREHPWPV